MKTRWPCFGSMRGEERSPPIRCDHWQRVSGHVAPGPNCPYDEPLSCAPPTMNGAVEVAKLELMSPPENSIVLLFSLTSLSVGGLRIPVAVPCGWRAALFDR